MSKYLNEVTKRLNQIDKDKNINKAAKAISKAYLNKNKTFTFGTGHSHMLGEELYARAGGWSYITPILLDELTLSSHPYKSTLIERVPEFASVLLGLFKVNKDDVIIISSNSGRNGLIVEMALRCKEAGATVIAVTSLTHSGSVSSRHSSGKLLKDIADIVIDNQSPSGDATIKTPFGKVAPVSTITGAFIGHSLVEKSLKDISKNGGKADIFVSSNLDNQDSRNQKLMDAK